MQIIDNRRNDCVVVTTIEAFVSENVTILRGQCMTAQHKFMYDGKIYGTVLYSLFKKTLSSFF